MVSVFTSFSFIKSGLAEDVKLSAALEATNGSFLCTSDLVCETA